MADAFTLIKDPEEPLSQFNKRIMREAKEREVTDVQLYVVDGEPVVTLLSETDEATEEDVDEAKDHGAELSLGDEIPAGDLLLFKVVKIGAVENNAMKMGRSEYKTWAEGKKQGSPPPDIAQITEERLDSVYAEAQGLVSKHLFAQGPLSPVHSKLRYPGEIAYYIGVAYIAHDEEADTKSDAAHEKTLTGK